MRSVMRRRGMLINEGVSLFVFTLLDLMDVILCMVYKIVDFVLESEWKPCYCSSSFSDREASNKMFMSQLGRSCNTCSTTNLYLKDDVSHTLYDRPSFLSDLSNNTLDDLKRLNPHSHLSHKLLIKKVSNTTFTVNNNNNNISPFPIPRWSDCDCNICTCWSNSTSMDSLFLHLEGKKDVGWRNSEDVLFIHGFISSSKFWTETVFPNFTEWTKSKYRLIAVDLLGFGRSPKPAESLYTLREHVEMIEKTVMEKERVKSFHIVAHSLGCIIAFAIAVKYPTQIKSLTLIAPPYFRVPQGQDPTKYVLRKVAPRRVWPPIAMGASIACWYEHISRTVCLLICKNHRLWEFLTKLFTRNRMRTFLMEGFFCHTHNAAWHTLHNIICGAASKLDEYLDIVQNRLNCQVNIFHGRDDELLPVECSYNVQSRVPRAKVKVVDNMDHITIVVSRQKAFARELEAIWTSSTSNPN